MGHNHANTKEYVNDMSKKETYGTTCELQAAGEIFPYRFEIWRNGSVYYCFGNEQYPVRRLRFSGALAGGHIDIYEPLLSQLSLHSPETVSLNKPEYPLPKRKKSKKSLFKKDRE